MLVKPALHSKLLAEFVGTFTLIAVGVGAVMNLGSVPGGLIGIAIAHGLAIGVMVTAVGHVSGGHLNPAVTVPMMVLKKISPVEGVLYIVAQLAGGAAGAALVKAAWPSSAAFDTNAVVALGKGVSPMSGMMLEAITTFLLVWTVFAVAVDRDGAFFKVAGLPIGFMVLIDILMIGPLTGATMNTARWFGPELITNHWANAWVWIVGPILGGVVAGALYMFGIRPREADAA
jgi:MIP family channel proteins